VAAWGVYLHGVSLLDKTDDLGSADGAGGIGLLHERGGALLAGRLVTTRCVDRLAFATVAYHTRLLLLLGGDYLLMACPSMGALPVRTKRH
jgi:hypothetical protein